MRKPFQFSMRRMLVAVSLFCVAVWLAMILSNADLRGNQFAAVFVAPGATPRAAFGVLVGRPFIGAMVGATFGLFVFFAILYIALYFSLAR